VADRHPPGPLLSEREIARAEAEELAWRELVRDELRSLRTAIALLGVLAAVALGIAVWALLSAESGGERRAVSAARVAALERRLDALQTDVERTPSSAAIVSLPSNSAGNVRTAGS